MSCYTHACSRYPENSAINIGINLEVAQSLKKLNEHESVEAYLRNAIDLSQNSLDTTIFCLNLLASHYIQSGK